MQPSRGRTAYKYNSILKLTKLLMVLKLKLKVLELYTFA